MSSPAWRQRHARPAGAGSAPRVYRRHSSTSCRSGTRTPWKSPHANSRVPLRLAARDERQNVITDHSPKCIDEPLGRSTLPEHDQPKMRWRDVNCASDVSKRTPAQHQHRPEVPQPSDTTRTVSIEHDLNMPRSPSRCIFSFTAPRTREHHGFIVLADEAGFAFRGPRGAPPRFGCGAALSALRSREAT